MRNIEMLPREKHLLATQPTPPEIVVNALRRTTQNGFSVLDIGGGDGRLVKSIREYLPDSSIFILDKDERTFNSYNNFPKEALQITGDALSLPFKEQTFGTVLSVNVAHEACSANTEEERLPKFSQYIKEVSRVLKPGGEFIFYDGIMTDNADRSVNLEPLSSIALNKFQQFLDTYTGKYLMVQQISNNIFRMSLSDMIAFITKIPYIGGEYWKDERNQLYPFLSENQIKNTLENFGFTISNVEYPVKREGLIKFLQSYKIDDFNLNNFPKIQATITAKHN